MPKDMQIFEPEMLQALVAIADTGSFTEAARLLDRSQSTISATIKRFEEIVGFKLVNRTTRTVLLTNDGKEMVRYAREVIELSRQARRRFSRSSHADSVRLGIFPNFDSPMMPIALREFNRLYPDVQVTLHHGRSDILLSRLQERTLDVVIAVRQQGHGFGPPLWQDNLLWVGNRAISTKRREPIPLATIAAPSMMRRIAIDALNGAGQAHAIAFESNSFVSVAAAINSGMAIGIFPSKLRPLHIPVIDRPGLLPALGAIDFVMLKSVRDNRVEVSSLLDILRGLSPALFETAGAAMFGRPSDDDHARAAHAATASSLPTTSII